jgi:hypothetical protein
MTVSFSAKARTAAMLPRPGNLEEYPPPALPLHQFNIKPNLLN